MNLFRWALSIGVFLFLFVTSAFAAFPERDIRVIVPWGAGGGTDAIVRKLTTIAEKQIGRSMHVENIEGNISATGVSKIMSADPDGYTIGVLTYDSVVTVPWQGFFEDYSLRRLKLIARLTSEADALIVSTKAPYHSLEDVLEAARSKPGIIKIGIQNIGSRLHLATLELEAKANVDFDIVPYPGGAAHQKEAMLNGEVDIVATSLGDFSSLLNNKQAMGVVEFSHITNPTFTTVPTSKDAGLDLVTGSFIIVAAPSGVSKEVVAKIEAAYENALHSQEFQSWVAMIGVTPDWLSSAEVTEWAKSTGSAIHQQLNHLVATGEIR